MRFRIVARSFRDRTQPFLVRLWSAPGVSQIQRIPSQQLGRHLKVGDSGRLVPGRKGMRFVPDAIDA
jgi:hypothetical protein